MKIRHFYLSQIYVVMIIIVYEKHVNIQKVIRCRQSKKDREYNRKRRKKAIEKTTVHKTPHRKQNTGQHEPHLNVGRYQSCN
jgi:hypothetical protein